MPDGCRQTGRRARSAWWGRHPGRGWPCATHGICKTPLVPCSFFRRQPDIIPSLSFSSQICQWVWGGEAGEAGLAARRTRKQFGGHSECQRAQKHGRRKPRRAGDRLLGSWPPWKARFPRRLLERGVFCFCLSLGPHHGILWFNLDRPCG